MKTTLIRQFFILLIFGIIVYNFVCDGGGDGSRRSLADSVRCEKAFNLTYRNFNAVIFMNPHNGIAVGSSGMTIRTRNGGYKWDSTFATTQDLYGVGAASINTIIAVGAAGTVVRSTNGGITWTSVPVNTLQTLRTVAFYSASNGYAAGDSGVVLSTTDFGLSWTKVHGNSTQFLYGLSYDSGDTLYIVGNGGLILQGPAFTPTSISAVDFRSIHFALGSSFLNHVDTGFIVGAAGTIYKTVNGGTTWTLDTSNTTKNLRSVFLTNSHWGYTVGDSGTVVRYNGKKWRVLQPLTTDNLNGVDNDISSPTDVCVGINGFVGIICPDAVPNTSNNVGRNTTNCGTWLFDPLHIDSFTDEDPYTGSIINYVSFTASSSHVITRIGSGWATHDNFQAKSQSLATLITHPPGNTTLRDLALSTVSGEMVYITCCLRDDTGNPWLLNHFQCEVP